MTITKRHYETIAKAINEAASNHVCSDAGWRGVRETAEKIADVLEQDNPRFHRSRFLDACGFAVEYTDPPAAPWQGDPTLGGRRSRKRRAYTPRAEQGETIEAGMWKGSPAFDPTRG